MLVKSGRATQPVTAGPQILSLLALIAGTALFGLLVLWLPSPLVLPALSLALLAGAALVALLAWRRPRPHRSLLGYWDLAGALTFIGIAAALLSEPDQVLPLLETVPLRATD